MASNAEVASSQASQECVAAKKGRVEARTGIARQCTAQIAGRTPDQPPTRPSAEAPGGSTPSFQIVPASTVLACIRRTLGLITFGFPASTP